MVCSPAKLASNRENAKRSTGPSVASRSRTRMNALKHGLTGAGITLPNEDLAEIERLSDAIHRELNPKGEVKKLLTRRVVFLACRLDRCERYDIAMLSDRVRHAEEAYIESLRARVDAYAAELHSEPRASVRGLQAMPEGILWLIYHWDRLREDLLIKDRPAWNSNHYYQMLALLGEEPDRLRVSQKKALNEALSGFFANLEPGGGWEPLSEAERIEWARGELLAIIDNEVVRLRKVSESLDHKSLQRERAESVDRVLFDPSKEAVLARKYEAATERSLYRALRELKKLDDPIVEPDIDDLLDDAVDLVMPPPEPVETPEPGEVASRGRGSLASFFQTPLAPPEIEESSQIPAVEARMNAVPGHSAAPSDEFSPRLE